MQKLYKVPLCFLLIASCIGLFLRYQLISPVEGIVYSYVLHAHSHVMFLGWVLNVLLIAFNAEFGGVRTFKTIFWFLQACVAGMLVSFPLQGYGVFSIILSTLHTVGVTLFVVQFFRAGRNKASLSLYLAKASLVFFVISSMAPFLLGYLKANQLHYTNLYRFCIYFYLHFQYNGCFFFGVLSLCLRLFEPGMSAVALQRVKVGSNILIVACLPAYFLSVLWARPSFIFNVVGFASALMQLIGLWFFVTPLRAQLLKVRFSRTVRLLLGVSLVSLILKMVLQVISSHPAAANFADEYRAVVIAYLHLVMIGVVSLFLFAWLTVRLKSRRVYVSVLVVISAFIGSELVLVASPWSGRYLPTSATDVNYAIFGFSCVIVLALGVAIRKWILDIS